MRVFRAGENPKIAQLLTAQRAARHHALDRLFQDALREAAAEDFVRADFLDAARIAGVAIIELLRQLLAGELHLVRIDDDDVVATIDVRSRSEERRVGRECGRLCRVWGWPCM